MMRVGRGIQQVVGLAAFMMMLTGCFQPQGDAVQPTLQSLPQPTNTFPPTFTPEPLLTNTPTEFVQPQNVFATSTTDPALFAVATTPPAAGVDQFSLQATQRVLFATQTTEAEQTQTMAVLLGPSATPTPTATLTGQGPVLGADCIHEVVAGENLFQLSQRYGLTVSQLAARNGVAIDGEIAILSVGQRLTIPGCGTTGLVPPATSTLPPTRTPVGFNPVAATATAQVVGVLTPVFSGRTHIVREGETLSQIARLYNVTADAIAAANGLTDPGFIKMGQTLIIP